MNNSNETKERMNHASLFSGMNQPYLCLSNTMLMKKLTLSWC